MFKSSLVSVFSEPYWQNFYTVQGKALNTTIKLGAWGLCTKYRVRLSSLPLLLFQLTSPPRRTTLVSLVLTSS
jgi:hypothetical protein